MRNNKQEEAIQFYHLLGGYRGLQKQPIFCQVADNWIGSNGEKKGFNNNRNLKIIKMFIQHELQIGKYIFLLCWRQDSWVLQRA